MAVVTRYTVSGGEVLSRVRSGARADLVPDPQGSVVRASGSVAYSASYWPYGEARSSTGPAPCALGHLGTLGYYGDGPGRSHVRARALRRDLARWQTADPLWPRESAYGYAGGNPTTAVDPSGMAIVDLRFRKIKVAPFTYHGYIVVCPCGFCPTDQYDPALHPASTLPWATSGGPENLNPVPNGFGQIVVTRREGVWQDGQKDYVDPWPHQNNRLIDDNSSASDWETCFKQAGAIIDRAKTSYNLFGPNSNTAALFMSRYCKLPLERAAIPLAPGWSTQDIPRSWGRY